MENPENPKEEDDVPTFTCEICIEPVVRKFKNKGNVCDHPFCNDCVGKYIRVKVEDDGVGNIECPGLNCNQLLDPVTCRQIIPNRVFDKWCDRLCDSALLDLETCYCPHSNCSALVVNECGGIVKRTECLNCKKPFCFECKVPWHAGYRCDESENFREINDVLFGELLEKMKWARCPRCGHCVERIAGCSSVICRCKTRFCYKCGKKFRRTFCGCKKFQLNHQQMCILTGLVAILVLLCMILVNVIGRNVND